VLTNTYYKIDTVVITI